MTVQHTDPATAEDRALNVIVDIAQERCDIGGHEHDWECALLQRSIVTVTKALSELEAAQARLAKVAEATPEQVAAWIDPEAWRHVEPHSSEYFKKRGAQAEYEANFAESVRQRREPSLAAAKRVLAKLLSGSARALGLGEEGTDA